MALGGAYIVTFEDGSSKQYYTEEEILRQKLLFLLRANKGDIPHDPEYGCDLIHFTFSPLDDTMLQAIEKVIRVEVATYMPYITIEKVELWSSDDEDLDTGSVGITVKYSVGTLISDSVSTPITGSGGLL